MTSNAIATAVEPVPYQFDGHNFSILDRDGEFWFLAPEVARELGYRDAPTMTRLLDDDEKGTHKSVTLGGAQEMTIISEPGLYRAIVQRRSNKKHDAALTAKIVRFQRWVFHDILPSVRKTGSYGAQPADPMKALSDPAVLRGLLADYTERVLTLQGEVEEMRPSVQALDRIANTDGSMSITEAAKNLQAQPKQLFIYLRTHEWIYRRPGASADLAYQARLMAGFLEHKTTIVIRDDGSEKTVTQVRVTPKGLTRLAKELDRQPA